MDSLSDIAVFVEVVKAGSFTEAAQRLQVSRSVVSKYLTRLEDRLGARLLHRTTRSLSLTEVGRTYFERCKKSLDALQDAEADVLRMQSSPKGVLRLNAPMSFGILHVAPLLAEFREQFPDVQVELDLDDRKVDVIDAGFDVSIRISDLPDSSLIARRLCACRHAIVAAPAYLKHATVPQTPTDLTRHRILAYRYQESSVEWHLRSAKGKHEKIALHMDTQINNSLAIREAVLAGLGIARMPTFVVGDDIKSGRLTALLTEYEILQVSIYLLFPERRHLSPKVRAFIDFMARRFQDPTQWD